MIEDLAPLLDFSEGLLLGYFALFVRVGAVTALLPGFGESFLPTRVRLAAALAFSTIAAPLIVPYMPEFDGSALPLARLFLAEALAGLVIGISIRLLVMALQLAGSIMAQSTSLVQIAGVGVTPDPMPAIGNTLLIAGLALALILDLHIKVIWAIHASYQIVPAGSVIDPADLATWGVARAASAFAFAFSLAAPFVIASLLYNVSLGAINRAMPQLMVAFIGAPAITGGSILLLLLASPVILAVWHGALEDRLLDPLGTFAR